MVYISHIRKAKRQRKNRTSVAIFAHATPRHDSGGRTHSWYSHLLASIIDEDLEMSPFLHMFLHDLFTLFRVHQVGGDAEDLFGAHRRLRDQFGNVLSVLFFLGCSGRPEVVPCHRIARMFVCQFVNFAYLACALSLSLSLSGSGSGLTQVDDGHLSTLACESERDGPTDSRITAGDECGAALQFIVAPVFLEVGLAIIVPVL